MQLPYSLAVSAAWLYDEMHAHQIMAFDGGGRLIVGAHNAELAPGRYLIVQLSDERDLLPANVLYRVPNDAA